MEIYMRTSEVNNTIPTLQYDGNPHHLAKDIAKLALSSIVPSSRNRAVWLGRSITPEAKQAIFGAIKDLRIDEVKKVKRYLANLSLYIPSIGRIINQHDGLKFLRSPQYKAHQKALQFAIEDAQMDMDFARTPNERIMAKFRRDELLQNYSG